jgi:2-polyprenyl-3-methyl-5-hydroxy-6-metoxy-1,4-benzoquinol methylase
MENDITFDQTAAAFASAIDKSVEKGLYVRGELFVAAALASVEPGGVILDYGCGPGRISAMLARKGYCVHGVDPSPVMLQTARQQHLEGLAIEFRFCPVLPDGPPERTYDAIVCSSVIEYVPDPERLLRWFHAALRPSGTLIVSFANSRSLWRRWFNLRHRHAFLAVQRHTWSSPQFRALLEPGFAPRGRPRYFDSPFDRWPPARWLAGSPRVGSLGLVVASKC